MSWCICFGAFLLAVPGAAALTYRAGSAAAAAAPVTAATAAAPAPWTPVDGLIGRLPPPELGPQQLFCRLKERVLLNVHAGAQQSGRLQSHWKTCAVVSSSGVLSKHKHGKSIDSADLVIRFNNAPLQPQYRDEVGTRDDVRFVNGKFATMLSNRQTAAWGYGYRLNETTSYALVPITQLPDLGSLQSMYPKQELYQVDVSMLKNLKDMLTDSYGHLWFVSGETTEHPNLPTSGAAGMLVALSICDEVRAYGMALSKDARDVPYHYYDTRGRGHDTVHHETLFPEKHLWRMLASNSEAEVDNEDLAVIPGFSTAVCPAKAA